MKVLYVVAEAYPLIKTGGLADVAGALPPALARLGVDVRVMIPGYGAVMAAVSPQRTEMSFGYLLDGMRAQILEARMPGCGIPLRLVDCPPLFVRDGDPYQKAGKDWPDNHLRFGMLARAAAEAAVATDGWQPDIVHANDWHTGLVPLYLRHHDSKRRPKTVFTVHNMTYQGNYDPSVLPDLALPPGSVSAEGVEFWGKVSFLKAGLVYADRITTVSPTYAREIQGPAFGAGMEGVLASRGDGVTGIVNGVDGSVWSPDTDPLIVHRYGAATLENKRHNRAELCRELGLELGDGPVVGVVGRLVEQKGMDLLVAAVPMLVGAGARLAVLGRGEAPIEIALQQAAERHTLFDMLMTSHNGKTF